MKTHICLGDLAFMGQYFVEYRIYTYCIHPQTIIELI